MTTAARPTWFTAKGGTQRGEKSLSALSKQYSARDLPAHTNLKYRQPGQGTEDDLKEKDFKGELEERERQGGVKRRSRFSDALPSISSKKGRPESVTYPSTSIAFDDRDDDMDRDDGASSSGEDDSEEEDDTAELLAELNRIKKERAEEDSKREADKKEREDKIRMENILSGNPLIQGSSGPGMVTSSSRTDFKVKRRWDEDVVFKNCARSEPDKSKPQFINDTLRSEFHKKFMEKYIK